MTFDAFCSTNRVTNRERDDLAWRLAQIRARNLYLLLRPGQPWNVRRQSKEGADHG